MSRSRATTVGRYIGSLGMTSLNVPVRILATLLCFGGLEGLLFHTNLYPSILEPGSSTGAMETQLRNELQRSKEGQQQVLAVGNSRMALLPRVANELKPSTGYRFASIGLGGATPRDWYYELRAVDPTARRYAAIIFNSDDYCEPDTFENLNDRESDIHYLIAQLRLSDLTDFPWTFEDYKLKWAAFAKILFKGYVYRRDFLDFLSHSKARIAAVRLSNASSAGWFYDYRGSEHSLAGLQIDYTRKVAQYPARFTADQRRLIQEVLLSAGPPDDGHLTAYLKRWYGRIIAHYRDSSTKLIFLQVPRAPVPPPERPPKLNSAIRQIASDRNVIVLDEHLFEPLERPELFDDALHLNGEGLQRFSVILAREVRRVLGPPQS